MCIEILSKDCQKAIKRGYELIALIKNNKEKSIKTNKSLADAMMVRLFDLYSNDIQRVSILDIAEYGFETDNFGDYILFVILKTKEKKYIYSYYSGALKYEDKKDAVSFCKDMEKITESYRLGLSQREIRKKLRKAMLKFKPKTKEEFMAKQREIKTYISFLDTEIVLSDRLRFWCEKLLHKKGALLCHAIING
jgi:hypothetical protein